MSRVRAAICGSRSRVGTAASRRVRMAASRLRRSFLGCLCKGNIIMMSLVEARREEVEDTYGIVRCIASVGCYMYVAFAASSCFCTFAISASSAAICAIFLD
jgi:hypothetical protein